MVLFCRVCDAAKILTRNWITEEDTCDACGATEQWRTVNEPKKAYALSENDRRFLRSIKVCGDV